MAVSVPSGAHVSFCLTYEELLPRRLGRYELSLGLRPGQPVENLTVDVSIAERTGINFIKVLPLRTSRLLSNTGKGKTRVYIYYYIYIYISIEASEEQWGLHYIIADLTLEN